MAWKTQDGWQGAEQTQKVNLELALGFQHTALIERNI